MRATAKGVRLASSLHGLVRVDGQVGTRAHMRATAKGVRLASSRKGLVQVDGQVGTRAHMRAKAKGVGACVRVPLSPTEDTAAPRSRERRAAVGGMRDAPKGYQESPDNGPNTDTESVCIG